MDKIIANYTTNKTSPALPTCFKVIQQLEVYPSSYSKKKEIGYSSKLRRLWIFMY